MSTELWQNLFVLTVPVLEKIIRPILVYVFLIVGLRLAGKRELAQLNPFDLIVLLTLSNTVQNAIIGNDNTVTGGVIGATTLLAVNYLVVRFLYSHQSWEKVIEGGSDTLIEDGKVLHRHLEKELLTVAELETAAHRQGFRSLEDVERAVLENGGTISFFAKTPMPDDIRHATILSRFDQLTKELTSLRESVSRAAG
ncbi:MAG TPA: YetF domain-containing protein [Lacipirellulaceae bacterium]|jgi:uncharacterized membrane protein YcaP (DUF421 family)